MAEPIVGLGAVLGAVFTCALAPRTAVADETAATAALVDKDKATTGFNLQLNGTINWTTGNVDSLTVGIGSTATVLRLPHAVAVSLQAQRGEQSGQKYLEQIQSHLRYNYLINQKFAGEAWATHVFDRFAGLDTRLYVGIGPAYQYEAKNWGFQLGGGYLLDYEQLGQAAGEEAGNTQTGHRIYNYIVFRLAVKPGINLVQAVYYRPRVDGDGPLADFRLDSSTNLTVALASYLSIQNAFTWNYDAQPPLVINKHDTQLTTSVLVNF